jgi:hypothetical protein
MFYERTRIGVPTALVAESRIDARVADSLRPPVQCVFFTPRGGEDEAIAAVPESRFATQVSPRDPQRPRTAEVTAGNKRDPLMSPWHLRLEPATFRAWPALEGTAQRALDMQRPSPRLFTFPGMSASDFARFRVFAFLGTLAATETTEEQEQDGTSDAQH